MPESIASHFYLCSLHASVLDGPACCLVTTPLYVHLCVANIPHHAAGFVLYDGTVSHCCANAFDNRKATVWSLFLPMLPVSACPTRAQDAATSACIREQAQSVYCRLQEATDLGGPSSSCTLGPAFS